MQWVGVQIEHQGQRCPRDIGKGEINMVSKKGKSRYGPTLRESVLMHAVSRIVFNGSIKNIQTSWVKMGPSGTQLCLNAGANDLGGTLMNESITSSAGAQHGQELGPRELRKIITDINRVPKQRTLYMEKLILK